jgi:endonuclease VIII
MLEPLNHFYILLVYLQLLLAMHYLSILWSFVETYSPWDPIRYEPNMTIRFYYYTGYELLTMIKKKRGLIIILVPTLIAAVQFNGPILQFTEDNPLLHESITRLGPDALKSKFDMGKAKDRLKERENMKLADLLLDQTFVAGIGNKYKSEILFLQKLWPFNHASSLSLSKQQRLLKSIREVLKAGYLNAGRTRSQQKGEPSNKWDYRHWVFRIAAKPCWVCGTKIVMDRQSSSRVTFWCSRCQKP